MICQTGVALWECISDLCREWQEPDGSLIDIQFAVVHRDENSPSPGPGRSPGPSRGPGLPANLLALQEALVEKTWRAGVYRAFRVTDTKPRDVVAAPFADRVVHTAYCEIVAPVLDPTFIEDTYACRPGKGTHAALERLGRFLRKQGAIYALKCDVSKFFASIDHARVRELLGARIKDRDVLWLSDRILESYQTAASKRFFFPGDDLFTYLDRPSGLPIGNLTSQLWSTLALDPLDRFVKQDLRCHYYVRYADDFVVLGPSKEDLHAIHERIRRFLVGERLRLDPRKCRVFPCELGVDFLGFVCHPGYRLLRKTSGMRFRARLSEMRRAYGCGEIDLDGVNARLRSWIAHASFGKTWRLRHSLFANTRFVKPTS